MCIRDRSHSVTCHLAAVTLPQPHSIQRHRRDARLSWPGWWLYPNIDYPQITVTYLRNNQKIEPATESRKSNVQPLHHRATCYQMLSTMNEDLHSMAHVLHSFTVQSCNIPKPKWPTSVTNAPWYAAISHSSRLTSLTSQMLSFIKVHNIHSLMTDGLVSTTAIDWATSDKLLTDVRNHKSVLMKTSAEKPKRR